MYLSILNLIISEPKLPLDNFHKMEFCFIQTTIAEESTEEYLFPVSLAERKATDNCSMRHKRDLISSTPRHVCTNIFFCIASLTE